MFFPNSYVEIPTPVHQNETVFGDSLHRDEVNEIARRVLIQSDHVLVSRGDEDASVPSRKTT